MKSQNWELKTQAIRAAYLKARTERPEAFEARLNLSWSNWGFGRESLADSAARLRRNGLDYIELHGNRYGEDLGYQVAEVWRVLGDHGLKAAGICGMFGPENDLSSSSGPVRQRAIDYIRRNVDLGHELGVKYFLIVPGAVGRPAAIDAMEFERSVETLRIVAHVFEEAGIRGAVEPIRSAEVSLVHNFEDALRYIEAVDSPGVRHINGDVYHMLTEEAHVADTVWRHGERLTNLHLADTNRCALGEGSLDIDTLIMALYLAGYNNEWCYCTLEPLGPGGDPYPAMHGRPDPDALEALVKTSAETWREREEQVRGLAA